jgi:phosphinothricin acetyltransferase
MIEFRNVKIEDAADIIRIYNSYVNDTIVTFDEEYMSLMEMERKVENWDSRYPWLVYEEDGQVIGYAYADTWKLKSAYRTSVETTIYLDKNATGKQIGYKLYSELIRQLKNDGFKVLIGCISLPNPPSIKLHEKLGFEKVGHFKQMGYKLGQWIDVGYWQLIVS